MLKIQPGQLVTPFGHRAGAACGAGHRGIHARAARLPAGGRAGVLADDRDRAAAGGGLGPDRAGRPADVRRPAAPHHLRAADGGRQVRLRRPGRALSPGFLGPPSYDQVPAVFAALRRTLAELFPVLGDVPVTPPLGRADRHRP